MDVFKYIALDVHIACIVALVMNAAGKVVQSNRVIPTSAVAIRKYFTELRGKCKLIVTFEEGTLSQWLYEIVRPLVDEVVVCNPRKNKLLTDGSKSDRIDTRKLADLLRTGMLKPVYHGEAGTGVLKELVRCYVCLIWDCNRVMNRLKAVFRSRGIATGGRSLYYQRNRQTWLEKIDRPGKRQRAEVLYRQFDCLRELRRETRRKMFSEARKHAAWKILQSIPGMGPIRTAITIAIIATPHRFRTKRQLWSYCGFSVITKSSSDFNFVEGILRKSRGLPITRGLNIEFNHLLKFVMKGAASDAIRKEPFRQFYQTRIAAGMRPEMARLAVARKIAAVILTLWKRGELFNEKNLNLAA